MMNTDKIPENLGIEDQKLATCFNSIVEAAKDFWERPLLQHYTNHGIDHSERIIEVLGNVLEGHSDQLNDYEKFILLASAYLHDIGMQSPQHSGLDKKTEYNLNEFEIIRNNHNEASAKMIIESSINKSDISLGLERCEGFANSVALVSKHHRSLDLTDLEDTSIGGKEIKLRLLAALLRLGDELDADYRRVNIDVLKLQDIPVNT